MKQRPPGGNQDALKACLGPFTTVLPFLANQQVPTCRSARTSLHIIHVLREWTNADDHAEEQGIGSALLWRHAGANHRGLDGEIAEAWGSAAGPRRFVKQDAEIFRWPQEPKIAAVGTVPDRSLLKHARVVNPSR
jgi:hypothetical protein